MTEWLAMAPDSARDPYCPSLKPHPFMGLKRFDAGRHHVMRSGKSYLRTHCTWDNADPTSCPRCN